MRTTSRMVIYCTIAVFRECLLCVSSPRTDKADCGCNFRGLASHQLAFEAAFLSSNDTLRQDFIMDRRAVMNYLKRFYVSWITLAQETGHGNFKDSLVFVSATETTTRARATVKWGSMSSRSRRFHIRRDSNQVPPAYVLDCDETLSEDILKLLHAPAKPNYPVIAPNDLVNYDAFLFGIPTRYGNFPGQWKVCDISFHPHTVWFYFFFVQST